MTQSVETFVNVSDSNKTLHRSRSTKRERLSLKLPKKDKSGVHYSELSLIANESCHTEFWRKNPRADDGRQNYFSSREWLNDRHMSAANSILKMQFPGINGLQETTGIPHYSDSDSQDKWMVPGRSPHMSLIRSGSSRQLGSSLKAMAAPDLYFQNQNQNCLLVKRQTDNTSPGPEIIKLFSFSTQLNTKFKLLINIKIVRFKSSMSFIYPAHKC